MLISGNQAINPSAARTAAVHGSERSVWLKSHNLQRVGKRDLRIEFWWNTALLTEMEMGDGRFILFTVEPMKPVTDDTKEHPYILQ
jgi:hypothetical protein